MINNQLLKLMGENNNKERQLSNEQFADMLMQEFEMSNILQEYLVYLKAKEKSNIYSNNDFIEYLNGNEILIKKTEDFHMGCHNHSFPTYLHRHNYLELDYVYKGECIYYIEDERTSFILKENELCIVNRNMAHALRANSPDDIIIKCFIPYELIKGEDFQKLSINNTFMENFDFLKEERSSYAICVKANVLTSEVIEEFLFHMYEEFIEKREGWNQAVKNYMSLLLLALLRLKDEKLVLKINKIKDTEDINIILECIKKNYPFVSLKALARDYHYNENYLSRKIKLVTGSSFTELINRYRLMEAQKLLENTDLTISEIAYKVGYLKPSYFYKLYKTRLGVTPKEYRSRYHNDY